MTRDSMRESPASKNKLLLFTLSILVNVIEYFFAVPRALAPVALLELCIGNVGLFEPSHDGLIDSVGRKAKSGII